MLPLEKWRTPGRFREGMAAFPYAHQFKTGVPAYSAPIATYIRISVVLQPGLPWRRQAFYSALNIMMQHLLDIFNPNDEVINVTTMMQASDREPTMVCSVINEPR